MLARVMRGAAALSPVVMVWTGALGAIPAGDDSPGASRPVMALNPGRPQFTNNIMLTGYWPPTGDMIRQFSANPEQNPGGWAGGNWEGRGYDVYSYFPEFPGGTGVSTRGVGDFEIDYQDTASDWWRIVREVRPIAIITLSWTTGRMAYGQLDWELEGRNRNRTTWTNDYQAPLQPDGNPPDRTIAPDAIRHSSLPMTQIASAVNSAGLGVQSYIDDFSPNFGGSFLSEFIGYHGLWWHDEHSEPFSESWNIAAGHIHVGSQITVSSGTAASEVTLRVLMDHLDSVIGPEKKWLSGMNPLLGDAPATLGQLRAAYATVPAPGTFLLFIATTMAAARRRR